MSIGNFGEGGSQRDYVEQEQWNRLGSNGVILLRRLFATAYPSESSDRHPFSYWRVAWESALAAGIGLGLPLVLMFWMVILANVVPSPSMNIALSLLQNTWYPLANEQQPSMPVHDFLMMLQIHITPASIALSLGITV